MNKKPIEQNKEHLVSDFMNMIRNSWTWEKLTVQEKGRFEKIIERVTWEKFDRHIRGNYRNCWRELQNIYSAFLEGCGYEPFGWRE